MLIDDIVRLEAEADAVVANARAEAERISQAAQEEVQAYRRTVQENLESRVSAFHEDAARRHARDEAKVREEQDEAIEALENMPDHLIRSYAAVIVERFENL